MQKPRLRTPAPIIHDSQLAYNLQLWMEHDGSLKNAFTKPDELAIFTAHNYDKKSLFERNLEFLGITDFDVIHIDLKPWNHTKRLAYFLNYLINDCRNDIVLYCDSDDVVIRDNPSKILDIFKSFNTDLLYNSTSYMHGYKCMPDTFKWANLIHPKRYLNGGAFIGKRELLIDVLTHCCKYVAENPPSTKYFYNNELEFINKFPYGIGCDQPLLRFLEPQYYPKLLIDSKNLLFYRNTNKTFLQEFVNKTKKKLYNLTH
jgi:hypothetical protein